MSFLPPNEQCKAHKANPGGQETCIYELTEDRFPFVIVSLAVCILGPHYWLKTSAKVSDLKLFLIIHSWFMRHTLHKNEPAKCHVSTVRTLCTIRRQMPVVHPINFSWGRNAATVFIRALGRILDICQICIDTFHDCIIYTLSQLAVLPKLILFAFNRPVLLGVTPGQTGSPIGLPRKKLGRLLTDVARFSTVHMSPNQQCPSTEKMWHPNYPVNLVAVPETW